MARRAEVSLVRIGLRVRVRTRIRIRIMFMNSSGTKPGLVSVLKIPCWRKYALRSFLNAALRMKKNSLVMCMRILKTRKLPREWVFLRLLYANAKNVCSENFVKTHRKNFLALEDSRLTKHSSNF